MEPDSDLFSACFCIEESTTLRLSRNASPLFCQIKILMLLYIIAPTDRKVKIFNCLLWGFFCFGSLFGGWKEANRRDFIKNGPYGPLKSAIKIAKNV